MKNNRRTRRHRRLSKQRIKSGKLIVKHKSISGRTGQIKSKQKPSSKPLGYRSEIIRQGSTVTLYNVYKAKDFLTGCGAAW
jgi:hypothetical protein